jgi:hypothetical protein
MALTSGYMWAALSLIALTAPSMLHGQGQPPVDNTKLELEVRGRPGVPMSEVELDPFLVASIEMGLEARTVKNRPFRAEMIVEIERKLADGNTLNKKRTVVFYRDHKGRLREEQMIEFTAPTAGKTAPTQTVTLNDPQTGTQHFLIPNLKMGFRMKSPPPLISDWEVLRSTPWSPQPEQQSTSQVLGNQVIEGIQCEGRIDTVKVPAGSAGNAYPMEIRTERWYSADLQINLLVKHTDPRNGETVIRMVNITREEPPESLFEVPADYRIQEGEMAPLGPPEGGNR